MPDAMLGTDPTAMQVGDFSGQEKCRQILSGEEAVQLSWYRPSAATAKLQTASEVCKDRCRVAVSL